MSPQELRRQYRAARTLERADAMRASLDQRARIATAVLAGAIGDAEECRVPGYRVTRGPDGIQVHPMPAYDAAQLELWRAMNGDA